MERAGGTLNTYELAATIIGLGIGEEPDQARDEDSGTHTVERHIALVQTPASLTDPAEIGSGAQKASARCILNSIGDAVASTDAAGKINYLNSKAEELSGWTRKEAIGRPVWEILRIIDANTRELMPDYLEKAVRTDRTLYMPKDCVLLRRDGSAFPFEDSIAPVYDHQRRTIGAVMVFRDISESQAVKREIVHWAQYDSLTGLPNRMLLNDRVAQAIIMASRHTKRIGLLFMELNGFEMINDTLGHVIAEELLQSISQRLVQSLRASDTVSRHGGDEFVILLAELEARESVAAVARRLLEAVSKPYTIEGRVLSITASIGISVYPEDGWDTETLFRNADLAMNEANDDPAGHGYRLFDPKMNGSSGARYIDQRE